MANPITGLPTQNNPYVNQPYTNQPNIQDTNSTAPHGNDSSRNPYASQARTYVPKREDTVYTKTMKEHFSFFGLGSLLYSVFFTFCLYKNASGITYPFFVIGTLCYFFFSTQKLGVPYKKDSIFYIISIVLLGISNCLTNSEQILAMNKCKEKNTAFIHG